MSRLMDLHRNGDCWSPTCPICAEEDAQAAAERGDT